MREMKVNDELVLIKLCLQRLHICVFLSCIISLLIIHYIINQFFNKMRSSGGGGGITKKTINHNNSFLIPDHTPQSSLSAINTLNS